MTRFTPILGHSLARRALAAALLFSLPAPLCAQSSSSSSSNSSSSQPSARPRPAVEAAGSGTSLDTSESLFDIAVGLNACGYDADLDRSAPVRRAIRDEVSAAIAASPAAQGARDRLCTFVLQHRLTDPVQNIAQYVYLALYASPPPELTPSIAETDMLPSAAAVISVLPLVRGLADSIQLHLIWIEHRPQYESLLAQIHDPLTNMILDTNTFLRLPVSNYDGRRFVVIMEPMLAPSQTISLTYDVNYFVVTSPQVNPQAGMPVTVKLDDIRHTYLHYQVEPLVYARTSTLDPFLVLLRHEQQAPVDFVFKSDIAALLTECLIKAAEVHLMDTGVAKPPRPTARGDRAAFERYTNAMNEYNRTSETIRRAAVDRDMRQGWAVTQYFYDGLADLQRQNMSLSEGIGPMLFGMEIEREREHESHIVFDRSSSTDVVRRVAPAPLTGVALGESKLLSDPDAAEQIANDVLKDPTGNHGGAEYLLGRLALLQGNPAEAVTHFNSSLKLAKDTHTLAMDHIYLGRLYDIEAQPERARAVAEYQAALAVNDPNPQTRADAEAGIKKPFALPKRNPQPDSTSDGPDPTLDPTGKAEKEAWGRTHPTQ